MCLYPIHFKQISLILFLSLLVILFFTTDFISALLEGRDIEYILSTLTGSRWFAWQKAVELVSSQPFIGFGADAKMSIYNPLINFTYYHPHNGFVLIAYETGLIGIILYFLAMGFVVKKRNFNHPQS